VKVILISGLSALLAGLLALGGAWLGARPARTVTPENDEPEVRTLPPRRARTLRLRTFPATAASPCQPRTGRACWRGRLLLSLPVRAAWAGARAVKRAELPVHTSSSGNGEAIGAEPGLRPAAGAAVDDIIGGDDGNAVADVPLPPQGAFGDFFGLRLIPRDDDSTRFHGPDPDAAETIVSVERDGSFEVQASPGSYDLEVGSRDHLLVGGADGWRAVAGDADGGLEIALAPPVAILGRIVDGDGVQTDAALSVAREHERDQRWSTTGGNGRFTADGLRPGAYRLTATAAGESGGTVVVKAPLDGIELHLAPARTAMLTFAPGEDGRCPTGNLTLVNLARAVPARLMGCQALVHGIPPGSTWQMVGVLSGHTRDRTITFDSNNPLTPICLDTPCRTDAAAVEIDVRDANGDRSWSDVQVVSGPDSGPPEGSFVGSMIAGLTATGSLILKAGVDDDEAGVTSQVWLRPGVNRVVMRLPPAAAGSSVGEAD
jgi:hypothetical protein